MDMVLCCETIEHLPNQYFLFQETSRIIKPGGIFILTTPNSSSLRSRFSQFMMESEHYSAPAPNELNAFTRWDGSTEGYFSKLFISGVLRLRTLAAINQLVLRKIHPTKRSSTAVLLLFWYPVLYYFNRRAMKKQIKQDPVNENTYRTLFELNTSMDVLLGKHLIMEFEKREVN
jgi:SAM-dependent methyltransferase